MAVHNRSTTLENPYRVDSHGDVSSDSTRMPDNALGNLLGHFKAYDCLGSRTEKHGILSRLARSASDDAAAQAVDT